MTRVWAVVIALGCGGKPPERPVDGVARPVAKCAPQFLGHVITTALAVAATDRDAYWIDYEFGRLQHRALDGTRTETLLAARDEQLISALVVAPPSLYWPSKGQHGVFRYPLAGGKPERVIALGEDFSEQIAYAEGVVYTATFDGKLAWWRTDGTTGSRSLGDGGVTLAGGDALYVGDKRGIHRLASPDAKLETIVEAPGVGEFVVAGDTVFWVETGEDSGTIRRRALVGGRPVELAKLGPFTYIVFAAAPNGVYVSMSNVVYFAPSTGEPTLRPVAYAQAEITDLAIARGGVVVGTGAGSAHVLCPDPARAITLAKRTTEPLQCEPGQTYRDHGESESCNDAEGRGVGPSREWYASGHLKSQARGQGADRRAEERYADGTPRYVGVGEIGVGSAKYFYANGKLASESIGESYKSYDLDGAPIQP